MSKVAKAFRRGQEWEKDEILDVFYWGRQVVGLLIGFLFGLIPVTGAVGISSGLTLMGVYTMIHTAYLQVDEEFYGGPAAGVKEGFANGFGLFM
eukprot:Ihof_evm4s164 gene=Ihof_evmTU4s164